MMSSKEARKAALKQWKAQQRGQYILKKTSVEQLFQFLADQIDAEGCDHTLRFTEAWLNANADAGDRVAILEEIKSMGGFCDCEVPMNCYEEYDIDS